jgi:hypothetical protein
MTLLAAGSPDPYTEIQRVKDAIGGGLASLDSIVSRSATPQALASEPGGPPCDLVIAGLPARDATAFAESLLETVDSHLLLVPATRREAGMPASVLICAAAGEPGKETIFFAGRLIRHFGATALLVTVVPPGHDAAAADHADRFLSAGVRTLQAQGVPARALRRAGEVLEEVTAELASGVHGLLVLGAPLAAPGEKVTVGAIAGGLLARSEGRPVLIVRSGEAALSR